ncbi:MAG TPA: UDP-N-acetylmuramate dehydrogenase [Caulobacteraceae bacterium]
MTDWRDRLPAVRGRLERDAPLAPYTWFRVGGPAEVLFVPADEADLSAFLKALDPGVPVLPIGVGSNLLVRDGGVEGVAIRLGRGFNQVKVLDSVSVHAGAAVPDAVLAREAAKAGIAGLEFYAGVPGTIGGAVVMNAGCYGSETCEVIATATVMDRRGDVSLRGSKADFDYSYRHSALQDSGLIVLGAIFETEAGDPAEITARIAEITARREAAQPIREKTGGSTFKNPPGDSAWRLVDAAGWRAKPFGGAMFSDKHANFLINTGEATAADLEGLGEQVRAEVKARFGADLEWEIKRVGRAGA